MWAICQNVNSFHPESLIFIFFLPQILLLISVFWLTILKMSTTLPYHFQMKATSRCFNLISSQNNYNNSFFSSNKAWASTQNKHHFRNFWEKWIQNPENCRCLSLCDPDVNICYSNWKTDTVNDVVMGTVELIMLQRKSKKQKVSQIGSGFRRRKSPRQEALMGTLGNIDWVQSNRPCGIDWWLPVWISLTTSSCHLPANEQTI